MKHTWLMVVALAACSAAAGAGSNLSPLLRADWKPPPGQRCSTYSSKQVPSPESLVDAAALDATLQRGGGLPAGSHGVFLIRPDSTGGVDSIPYVEGTLPEAQRATLQQALAGAVKRQAPGNPGSVLLRVDAGNPLRLRVGKSEECAPELRNREEFIRLLDAEATGLVRKQPGIAQQKHVTLVQVFVDSEGNVSETQVQELSGERAVDSLAINLARQAKFHPALWNRKPVPAWVQFPITLNFPSPPRPDSVGLPIRD